LSLSACRAIPELRYLDKLIDRLAKAKAMEKIFAEIAGRMSLPQVTSLS
jgi:hypothetical protein